MEDLTTKEFIDLVRKRPGMYVFSEGITELSGLLRGYYYSRRPIENEDILNSFTEWLKTEKYEQFKEYSVSWCRILLFYYSCEYKALEKFFEFWDEFLLSRGGK